MPAFFRIAIVSDIHYAASEERVRCAHREYHRQIKNPAARAVACLFHNFVWLREPGSHNPLLDRCLGAVGQPDLVVANGDYSCNFRGLGLSDPAAFASTEECLSKLRATFNDKLRATLGDHELGKAGLFTGHGAMSLASWHAAVERLRIEPFWQVRLGKYVLLGVTSSLIALPIFKPDSQAGEGAEWEQLRETHLREICEAFASLKPDERVWLFCHDPTALPFLGQQRAIREKLPQLEQTVIGHLHSNLVLWGSGVLSGLPTIWFLGKGVRRISAALSQARYWKPFRVRLCPSLPGIQALKDGGFLTAELDADARRPARIESHGLKW